MKKQEKKIVEKQKTIPKFNGTVIKKFIWENKTYLPEQKFSTQQEKVYKHLLTTKRIK